MRKEEEEVVSVDGGWMRFVRALCVCLRRGRRNESECCELASVTGGGAKEDERATPTTPTTRALYRPPVQRRPLKVARANTHRSPHHHHRKHQHLASLAINSNSSERWAGIDQTIPEEEERKPLLLPSSTSSASP
jgi:hypothetical protein